ncbi:MAG: hypothetical protein QF521_15870 [Alphaproteobacteria bacterium]|nr:hypothetical protein [Alphaproteobacteria bacterium]
MKQTALAALLATTVAMAPWQTVKSAESGDFLYGQRLYSLGDYGGALGIWQELAKQGDARAQYSMAILYLKGRGVPKDRNKAKEWASRAAEQGYKPGQRLLQKLQTPSPKTTAAKKSKQRKPQRKPLSEMTELERVEASVEDLLQQIGGKIAQDGQLVYGELRTERLDDVIAITVPDMEIQSTDGGVFQVGTVLAHVRRLDPRFDDITLTLPGEMNFRQADGDTGRVTMAKHHAKLRWDRQLRSSTEFEFRLGEIRFLLDAEGEMGRIDEVLVQAEVPEKDGQWTGPMRFALQGVKMTNREAASLRLDRAAIVLDLRGLDIGAYKNNGQGLAGSGQPPLKQILGMASGVGLRTEIDNLAVHHPGQGTFQLSQANYGLDLSNRDGKLLNLALTAVHHGLTGSGSAAPEAMVPGDLDIALAIENVPSETVINVGVAAVVEIALLGEVSSAHQVFLRLRRELSGAAAVLRLKRAKILAKDYEIFMGLTLAADNTAKAGMVGGGELRIKGLDKLLAVSGGGQIPPIAAFAKKGKRLQGRRGHLFNLAVRPDGLLTVNDEPLVSLAPFDEQAQQ